MKIYTHYVDGEYSMEEYTDGHVRAGLHFVEIDEVDWRAYQLHQQQCRRWHEFIGKLDNQIYEMEHAHE